MSTITAIVTVYRRPNSVCPIVDAIRRQSVGVSQLWAWANDPSAAVTEALAKARLDRVVKSSVNAYFHARFALALTVPTEFVAIFDDDSVPGPRWFEHCLATMDRTPGILGAAGVRLHDASYAMATKHGWHQPVNETVAVDLVGHAWFLRTQWLHYLFSEPAVIGTNGEDIELAARAMRLGGIPCYCPPHPPSDRTMWGSVRGAELGDDDVASFRRANHVAERDQIVRAELERGWKPLFMRAPSRSLVQGHEYQTQLAESASDLKSEHSSPGESLPSPTIDLLAAIPQSAGRILLVNCVDQSLATQLKMRQQTEVETIDLDANYGRSARSTNGDSLKPPCSFEQASFDCVVSEQFDRFRRPEELLRAIRTWLKPGGLFVAVADNMRYHSNIAALMEGRWPNGNGKTNGRSHQRPLRLYTRREIEKVLFRAGLQTVQLRTLPGAGFRDWDQRGRPNEVSVGPLRIASMSGNDPEEYYAAGFLVTATPDGAPDYGLTSIVIVTHNQLEYTRQCIDSIRHYTDERYELVFVDNASTDGTAEWLKSIEHRAESREPDQKSEIRSQWMTPVTVIENVENLGFPKAANQGIQAASGRQILLLNNDTLVTTGWLCRLLHGLYSHPRIGLIGPCSNHVSGLQFVTVSYDDLTGLDGFAWDRGKSHDQVVSDTDRLVGFCLLIRREVVDKIGLLDERFSPGNFEDDDYCVRALDAGFRVVIARDSFVHHFGERTFAGTDIRFGELLARNQRLFQEKLRAKYVAERGAASS